MSLLSKLTFGLFGSSSENNDDEDSTSDYSYTDDSYSFDIPVEDANLTRWKGRAENAGRFLDPPTTPIDGEAITLNRDRIAWKSTRDGIVKLLIPEGEEIVAPSGSMPKLRASAAVPLEIQYPGGTTKICSTARSHHDPNFQYELGKVARPEKGLDRSTSVTCSSGIHFYPTRHFARQHHRAH